MPKRLLAAAFLVFLTACFARHIGAALPADQTLSEKTSTSPIVVSAADIWFTGVNQKKYVRVSESGYTGTFSATSADPNIANVMQPTQPNFTVVSTAAGSTTVTVRDTIGNSRIINVVVSLVTEYPLPGYSNGFTSRITSAGNYVWFNVYASGAQEVGRINMSGVEGMVPNRSSLRYYDLAPGSNDSVWLPYPHGAFGKVWETGAAAVYPVSNTYPMFIAHRPGSSVLWFTDQTNDSVGSYDTASRTATEYALSPNRVPQHITLGPDGNMWFAEIETIAPSTFADHVCKITPQGVITEYDIPNGTGNISDITTGPDGNLWFTDGNQIGYVTTSGLSQVFGVPDGAGSTVGIAKGPDNRIWVTDFWAGEVYRATINAGTVSYKVYGVTGSGRLGGITAGPDGNMWFIIGYSGTTAYVARINLK